MYGVVLRHLACSRGTLLTSPSSKCTVGRSCEWPDRSRRVSGIRALFVILACVNREC